MEGNNGTDGRDVRVLAGEGVRMVRSMAQMVVAGSEDMHGGGGEWWLQCW